MQLSEFLMSLVASGILGGLGMPLLAWIESRWPWLAQAEPWVRRAGAWIIGCGLGVLPYLVQVLMQYEPAPSDWRGWVEQLFAVAFVAITANQGVQILGKKRKD